MPKILLIEDNREILYINQVTLELEGYEVLTAMSLAVGRRLALSELPDLIILDIMLPDGRGLDLCRELRAEGDFKIIFLSALGTKTTSSRDSAPEATITSQNRTLWKSCCCASRIC